MLKFLENRTHEQPPRSPKKYQPQFLYGNSFQTPKQFQTNYTLFHKPSYVNPHLNYEKQRRQKLPSQSFDFIQPSWKRKVDLQSVEEQKIVSSNPDIQDTRNSRYLTSFYHQFDRNRGRFRKSKGEFTSFIQKNNKFKSLGPLHGDQRDQARINQTKKSVWLKPSKSEYQTGRGSFLNSSLNVSLRSSISKNSQLLIQKNRIRQNRQKVYNNYKKQLQQRKKEKANSFLFQLPKKGPQHQLTFFNTRQHFNRYSLFENKVYESQSQQLFRDIDKFEVTAYRKIK